MFILELDNSFDQAALLAAAPGKVAEVGVTVHLHAANQGAGIITGKLRFVKRDDRDWVLEQPVHATLPSALMVVHRQTRQAADGVLRPTGNNGNKLSEVSENA